MQQHLKKAGIALAGIVVIYAAWIVISTTTGFAASGVGTLSEGVRTGFVLKYSSKGIGESGEGQLLIGFDRGGILFLPSKEGESAFSPVFEFSVYGEQQAEIAKKLELAMKKGTRVILHYKQTRIKGVATYTDYLIQSVELCDE